MSCSKIPDPNAYDPNARSARRPLSSRAAMVHSPPARDYVILQRYTLEEFFKEAPPFSQDTIMKFVQREEGWDPAHVPNDVFARGGLRLAVWVELRPTPTKHFEEVIKRLPCIKAARNAKDVFLKSARLQQEAKRDKTTRRCSICASQLLGYAYEDHDRKYCPFKHLTTMNLLDFMANNLIAYCNHCNSRSTSHKAGECDATLRCQGCHQAGHTSIQKMCWHPLGYPNEEAQTRQKNAVQEARLKYLSRLQTLITDPKTTISYIIRSDYDYEPDLTKRHTDDARGWGFRHSMYAPKPSALCCSNLREGKAIEYPSMVSPEFRADIQNAVPQFDPLASRYLQQVGDLVTRIRKGESILESQWPVYNPDNELGGEQQKDNVSFDEIDERVEFSPSPPRSARSARPPRVVAEARTSKGFDREETDFFREHAPHAKHRTTPPPPPAEFDPKEFEAAVDRAFAAERARATVSAPNFQAIPHEQYRSSARNSSNTHRNRHTRSANHNGQGPSNKVDHQDEYSPEEDMNRSFEKNTKEYQSIEINEELRHSRSARVHLREVSIIDGKAARASFEKKAFDILANSEPPTTREALVIRADALQEILAGSSDDRYGIYAKYQTELIGAYAVDLIGYGHRLYHEPFLFTQLHSNSPRIVQMRFREGADILYIPTIDIWSLPSVMEQVHKFLYKPNTDGLNVLENFSTIPRQWFSDPLVVAPFPMPEGNQMKEEQELDDQFHWDHNPVKRVLEFPTNMLKAYLDLGIPTQTDALMKRIGWTVRMLTLSEFNEDLSQDPQYYPLVNYLKHLRAAVAFVLALREECTAVNVQVTDCYVTMATEASRAHQLTLPSLVLFATQSPERWRAWTNLSWTQLRAEVTADWRTHECPCHEPEDW